MELVARKQSIAENTTERKAKGQDRTGQDRTVSRCATHDGCLGPAQIAARAAPHHGLGAGTQPERTRGRRHNAAMRAFAQGRMQQQTKARAMRAGYGRCGVVEGGRTFSISFL